ncbi:MAG: hypothetical protein Q8P12_02630 [bacterium]|nr:hypothetical protein [bacterium]MDZ4345153.1 hypothetical protein [Candidatus Binatia bacterium]
MNEVEVVDKVDKEEGQSSVPMRRNQDDFLMSVPMELVGRRFDQLQEFLKKHLKEGRDYGRVPGVDKPFLFKPGAENLCLVFGLRPEYEVLSNHNFSISPPYFSYEVKCRLYSQNSGTLRGEGVGHCNSWEPKYRYRNKKRTCPLCGKEAINRSKYPPKGKPNEEPGWYCYSKQGGCGAGFLFNDSAITNQVVGRVVNEDVSDLQNTILKMSKKRAYEDATLTTTGASGLLTQDPEAVGMSEENFNDAEEKQSNPSPTRAASVAQTEPAAPAPDTENFNKVLSGDIPPTDKPRFWTTEEAAGVGETLAAPCFDGDRNDLAKWFSKKHTPAEFSLKRIELDMRVAAFKRQDTEEPEQQSLGIKNP